MLVCSSARMSCRVASAHNSTLFRSSCARLLAMWLVKSIDTTTMRVATTRKTMCEVLVRLVHIGERMRVKRCY